MRNIEIYKNKVEIGGAQEVSNGMYDEAYLSSMKLDNADNIKAINLEVTIGKEVRRIKLKFGESLISLFDKNCATVKVDGIKGKDIKVKVVSVVNDEGVHTKGCIQASLSMLFIK